MGRGDKVYMAGCILNGSVLFGVVEPISRRFFHWPTDWALIVSLALAFI